MTTNTATRKPRRHQLSEQFADPDLVDRIFDYILQLLPELAQQQQPLKDALRREFGGATQYVRQDDGARQDRADRVAQEVRRLFNGRNATTIARELRISRATVYRCLKQSGVKG